VGLGFLGLAAGLSFSHREKVPGGRMRVHTDQPRYQRPDPHPCPSPDGRGVQELRGATGVGLWFPFAAIFSVRPERRPTGPKSKGHRDASTSLAARATLSANGMGCTRQMFGAVDVGCSEIWGRSHVDFSENVGMAERGLLRRWQRLTVEFSESRSGRSASSPATLQRILCAGTMQL